MKATEAKLLQILGNVSQFIIPIYQRTYSWTLKECQQLWEDILRAGTSDEIGVHFIGSVVHIDEGLGTIAVQAPEKVDTAVVAAKLPRGKAVVTARRKG